MPLSHRLALNAVTQVEVGDFRINDDEWGVDIRVDDAGAFLFVSDENLEDDDNVDTDFGVYLVDDEHLDIVEEWLVEHRAELLDTQTTMSHLNLGLITAVEVDGTQYNVFMCYAAD